MICNQLSEANQILSKLVPQPPVSDIVRVVCRNCTRLETCPSLYVDLTDGTTNQTRPIGADTKSSSVETFSRRSN